MSAFDLVVQPIRDAPRVPGRRPSVAYYDLGLSKATQGALTAQFATTSEPFEAATGWHFHDVDAQMIFVIRGWFDIAFADGSIRRVDEGTFALIPGGMVHNEIDKSAETEAIEIILGTMLTVPVEAPSGVDLSLGHFSVPDLAR